MKCSGIVKNTLYTWLLTILARLSFPKVRNSDFMQNLWMLTVGSKNKPKKLLKGVQDK